jgi:multimeric flavodoxin WrbA
VTDILGLVGSARPWGNSEILVREVLRSAKTKGATIRMVRLPGLTLAPCNGCLRCVIGGKPCPLDDDLSWLLETIDGAGALVLAAPTYFLGPAAVVKLVMDRLLMVAGQLDREVPPPRPAVTIATAGLAGWRGVTLPYLNALVAAFGFQPIESRTAVAPGPGEVLLDEELMAWAAAAGRRLGRGELEPAPAPASVCPICRCDAFTLDGGRAACPICGRQATVSHEGQALRLEFDPAGQDDHRWTPEALRKHIVEWVMATGPRFMERRQEIKARRRPYREADIGWLCPPPEEDQPGR